MATDPYTITYYRGDFYPKVLTITDKKTRLPIDLTGSMVKMTVNSEKNPVNTDNEMFSIVGVITDAANGVVSFTPTAADTDQPAATYWYDLSMVIGTASKRTLLKAPFVIVMDIGKD